MHVHHYQGEVITVQQGRIGYQRLGEAPRFAGPGETVAFEAEGLDAAAAVRALVALIERNFDE